MGVQQVDSATLRHTKVAFTSSAGNVNSLIATIRSSVNALLWTGGIAEQFKDTFHSKYEPMLRSLQEDMEATATALEAKATQYDEVFG